MPPFRFRGLTVLALVTGAVLSTPSRVEAQGPPTQSGARLQGVVVDDATGQPVESATVSVVGTTQRLVTGRWGSFEFPDAPMGSLVLQVAAPGHPSVRQDVEVRAGRVVFMRVVLPSVAAVLESILVQGGPEPAAAQVARTAADLLALDLPRTSVSAGVVGASDFQVRLRQATSFQGNAAPAILLDGVVLSRGPDAFEALERIPADDVEDIEALSGPTAAFLYPWAANGVILVRTKRGVAGR